MRIKDMELLSDAELRKLSLQRSTITKTYTKDAILAQRILRERAGIWAGISREAPSYEVQLRREEGW